jgi:molybdopterin-guanine dinucleotide biosynthesis protein A
MVYADYFASGRSTPACDTALMATCAAILAGGAGSRIGGDKALVALAGRPLIDYALQAAEDAGLKRVVVAKRHTRLPSLPPEVSLLLEPDEPQHPLLGVVTALSAFAAVIAIPCDMPFIDAGSLTELASMPQQLATLCAGQPFPSLYRRGALPALRAAVASNRPVRSLQAGCACLHPSDPAALTFSVNTLADLAAAAARLSRR